jgi:two-component system nitrogen regulation sensor histidine kinase NtrY
MPAINPTPNRLNDIIAEALVLYQEGHKEVEFVFRPAADIPVLNLDHDQIKRAVINMLDNAVSAVGERGNISIETHFNPTLQITSFTISDDGCGITAEDKPRLFEPYFSTKKSGTGLGLAIVSTIITDHNGYIRVKDNIPKGTKIIVELPVGGESAQA